MSRGLRSKRRRQKFVLLGGTEVAAPPTNPPTIQYDVDPVTSLPGQWTVEPGQALGSPTAITGTWGDPDASVSKPIASIVFEMIGSIDPSRNPLPGTVTLSDTAQTTGTFSFDLTALLIDDRQQLKATITDSDGLTAEASVTLDVNYSDAFQEATGHPVPDLTPWSFTSIPIWQNDQPNGGTTWATSTTGYGGGIIVDETGFELNLTAAAATDTVGDLVPRFQVHVPDDLTDIRMYMELDGFEVDDYYVPGPLTTTTQDEINMILFEQQLTEGSTVYIHVTGQRENVTGPPPSQLPFVTFSDLKVTNVPGPPPEGTEIFNWTAGITAVQAEWTNYRTAVLSHNQDNSIPLYGTPPTRPVGQNAVKMTQTNGHRLFAGQGHEVAQMQADGTLIHEHLQDWGNQRTLIAMQGSGTPWDAFYLKPGFDLEFEFRMDFLTDGNYGRADYRNPNLTTGLPWGIIFELWSPMNWPGWVGGGDVPVQIIVDQEKVGGIPTGSNQLLARVRGSTQSSPTDWTVDTEEVIEPFAPGRKKFKIQTKIDYTGSYFKLWFQDSASPVIDLTQSVGVNAGGNTVVGGLVPYFGWYHSSGSKYGGKVRSHYMRIRDRTGV